MRPSVCLDSRPSSTRRQRTELLTHPTAHIPLLPQMFPLTSLLGQGTLKSREHALTFHFYGALELSWLTPPEVLPNISIYWPPLPSPSRAKAETATQLLFQAFQTKHLSVKVQAKLRADILWSKRLSMQFSSWMWNAILKGHLSERITDTWISALTMHVRGFPKEPTCSLY